MKKDFFEGLCSIINEMSGIRQKAQQDLVGRSKNYNLPSEDLVHLKLQIRHNSNKIAYYARMKNELRNYYETHKDHNIET